MFKLLQLSPLGDILTSSVPNDDQEAHKMLCCLYLKDYIHSTYKHTMLEESEESEEQKVIVNILFIF